jgi:predicted chitinase
MDSLVIEGLSRNADLVAINTITSSFKPDSGRLELIYTIIDTLNLTHTKLEIYKLNEEDTTMVTFYTGLEKGEDIEFTDSHDDDKKGWSGKGSDGEFVGAGNYLVKLTATTDETYGNGFEDYEVVEVEDVNAPEFEITTDQLEDIFPDTDKERIKEVVNLINKYSNDYGLTTKTRMAHFLGQIGTETAGLEKLKESSNYSAKNIFAIFLKVKRKKENSTDNTHKYCDLIDGNDCSDLSSCIGDNKGPKHCSTDPDYDFPEKDGSPDFDTWDEDNDVKTSYINSSSLFDYVYSCRMDNGAKSTNDGSTYLGKGFIHMTGKDKYKKVSEAWNKKYPNDKKEFHGDDINELENNVEIAMKASLVLWELDGMNAKADGGIDDETIIDVTEAVNGGTNGLDHRKKYTKKANEVFSKD